MGLFGFGKKKEEKSSCACGGKCSSQETETKSCCCSGGCGDDKKQSVKVLGGGCAKCDELAKATVKALEELGMDTNVEHVTDFSVIATYGVMTTPALVIDEKVVSFGKVLKTQEVVEILKRVR